ncbi:MAG: hypothetical protein Q8S29_01290 [Phreatobacter sp.]|nr:hypothetical protein [Phreatobacter sp.]
MRAGRPEEGHGPDQRRVTAEIVAGRIARPFRPLGAQLAFQPALQGAAVRPAPEQGLSGQQPPAEGLRGRHGLAAPAADAAA